MQRELWKNPLFAALEVRFIVIGSVIEGTRVGRAGEMDVTMAFEGLKETPFSNADDPTHLRAPFVRGHILEEYLDGEGWFLYPKFLGFLLDSLAMAAAAIGPRLPRRMKFAQENQQFASSTCHGCMLINRNVTSVYHPRTHCGDCMVAVAFSKMGPCLGLLWKADDDGPRVRQEVCTIDLVPVYTISTRDPQEHYSAINKKNLEDRPPGWISAHRGFINRDRYL